MGKVDRTADEIFDDHVQNFNKQQNAANKLQKELNNYIRCVKGELDCFPRDGLLFFFYGLHTLLLGVQVQLQLNSTGYNSPAPAFASLSSSGVYI